MTKWRRILYQPNLPLGENGKRVTACPENIRLSKNAAKEGMVLLKNNNGLLPFARGTKLALFGIGTFDYVKGGGGSAVHRLGRRIKQKSLFLAVKGKSLEDLEKQLVK